MSTKSILGSTAYGSDEACAIPDAINLGNIENIRRGAIELNHHARRGMPIILPIGMDEACKALCADIGKLISRSTGLRVVNTGESDPATERAAIEYRKQMEREEKSMIIEKLSVSLAALRVYPIRLTFNFFRIHYNS